MDHRFPHLGQVVTVAEADYCYGTGSLRLRLTEEPVGLDHPRIERVELIGVELRRDGTEAAGGRTRSALVRVAALRRGAAGEPR
ncbi:hypothetical protein [Micromonospora mirobrigensis]|uniref:Uncharacterized protein n=1 Tax=Micromonospora mirobrigensis TaxID=262898 RepID=A0A1C4TYY2_9ACTN|nr:hypothetical protein [Micromonospora mirobrigensis]SCE64587.1 hypothetical protein GA0070564_10177 [Micromonospora mirobrigensis]